MLPRYDFIIPNYKLANTGVEFDFFRFFCDGAPTQYKQVIESPKKKSGYAVQNLSYKRDVLALDEEKELKIYILRQQKK